MTDSTDTKHDDFVNGLIADRDAYQAEQDRLEAEHEAAKSIARGALTQLLLQADLDVDDLTKVATFVESGCDFEQVVIVGNDGDSTELDELKARLATAERERDEFKTQAQTASQDCKFHLDLKNQKNLDDSIRIFGELSNGNGGFVNNATDVIKAGQEKIREDAVKAGQEKSQAREMPSGPPQQRSSNGNGSRKGGRGKSKDDKSDKPEKKPVKDWIFGK